MSLMTVIVPYLIGEQYIRFELDEYGDPVSLRINGHDYSHDGDKLLSTLDAIKNAGHDLQCDFSRLLDAERAELYMRYRRYADDLDVKGLNPLSFDEWRMQNKDTHKEQ